MPTINGKACVANGRNLLLDTNFNNLPQYWTARAGTVTGTFNGHNVIYYDAKTITGNSTDVLQQPIYDPALTTNRVLPSHWYTLSFYAKGVGQMTTYVYGSFVDTSAGSFVDGIALGYANADGSHIWDLNDGWTRHTYTFKSKSSFLAMGVQNVLWRLFKGNEVYITMPKLDEGTIATPLTPAPVDKVFSNGKQVYGRNLLVNTSSSATNGRTTMQGTISSISGVYSRTDSYEQVTAPSSGEFYYRFVHPDTNNLYSLTPGETYTLSGSASHTAGELMFRSQYSTDGSRWNNLGFTNPNGNDLGMPISDGSVFTPFSHTFTIPVGATGVYFSLQNYDYTAGGLFRFKNMKLEKGSVATPWSPAPEDVM